MEAKELRIGQYYFIHNSMGGNEVIQQFTNWTHALDFEGYGSGIPLTPELLEKAGFERDWQQASETNWTYKKQTRNKTLITYHCGTSSFMIGEPIVSITTIIYVHQLQNIMFALTGEELTINL